ncbi:MAG: acetoacetate--CoA ligase [Nocardiaceae bacterium]|nr:acetoacetate--CoA ligase [Nocardiaceae bacterium]
MTEQPRGPQWSPTAADVERARITDFARWVERRTGLSLPDYPALWRWSVDDLGAFWQSIWDYFEIESASPPGPALADDTMPGAVWFPGAELNYVDHVMRNARADRPAIVYESEDGAAESVSWAELRRQTAALAETLRSVGVGPGDRVVGYLPDVPEAIVAFLATASLGAVWAACGQDYAAPAALDRLGQLEPTVLIAADGYRFAGREHRRGPEIARLRAGMPSLAATVVVPRLGVESIPDTVAWCDATAGDAPLEPVPVPFDHPLWVVFSSGTTGLPKGIVHGHGGVLLEHLKAIALQSDLGSDDVFFWYTSPSWMMWNFQVAGLLVCATIVCYDGSPAHPTQDRLWEIAARRGVTVLGTSPGYVMACEKAGVVPARDHDLAALHTVGITGSTLPAALSWWLADNVGWHVQVASISGGTDVVSAFVGAAPTVPVWPGELSVPYLGVALDAFDESGRPVRGDVGELVVTRPMPSMPVRFWNDPDGSRYRDSYFDVFPGVWRHGDWISITERGGVVMHGRSDSTLNRGGVRMGSADIYQVVERLPEIAEALVVGVERADGGYWMPLFVVLADGIVLDDTLRDRIRSEVRTQASPRHVPDEIVAVPGVPHTRTGKKLEVPIKRLFQGGDPQRVVDRSAVDDADLFDWFARFGAPRRAEITGR